VSQPLRVALVSEHASPLAALGPVDAGGQNVHVAALALALGRRGVEVTVHTRRDGPALPHRVAMADRVHVEHVDAGPARELPKDTLLPHMHDFARALFRSWSARPPDVVHAHFWMSGHASLTAARALGIPVVQTFHALGVVKRRHQGARDTSPPQRPSIERSVVRRVDRIVATCQDEVIELRALGADPARVSVVPCGVDLELFGPTGPVWPPPRRGRHRLVVVGRMVERKGLADAVRALAMVPGAELLIAGGPERAALWTDPEARRLGAVAEHEGVGGRVELIGRVGRDRVPALLRSADVVVCVPWYEPFGIVPLEAMACGVPVVASAVGGMLDTVVDGGTGVLVPPRRPDRLAAAIRDLLACPGRRARMGAAGVRRVRRLYHWDRVAALTLDAYAAALETARERAGSEVG
jgi:glycosyltransferase involved in cell wall biosynthesis